MTCNVIFYPQNCTGFGLVYTARRAKLYSSTKVQNLLALHVEILPQYYMQNQEFPLLILWSSGRYRPIKGCLGLGSQHRKPYFTTSSIIFYLIRKKNVTVELKIINPYFLRQTRPHNFQEHKSLILEILYFPQSGALLLNRRNCCINRRKFVC